jgi:hypothetical protein
MNKYDYFIPLLVIIIVLAILLYFKRKSVFTKEDFTAGKKIDLSEYGTRIYGDLFMGFSSRDTSDKTKDTIKKIISENPQKFKNIDLRKSNIYINGNHGAYTVPEILLGNGSDNSITKTNLDKFDQSQIDIPEFKLGSLTGVGENTTHTGDFVYYNGDTTETNQNKLCITKAGSTDVKCIEPRHLDMINGKMLIKFKMYDSKDSTDIIDADTEIKSYNLEYAQQPSFENVAQRTFFMTETEYDRINGYLPNTSTCFRDNGRHNITGPFGKARMYSGNFYLNAQDTVDGSYSHIHSHKHD